MWHSRPRLCQLVYQQPGRLCHRIETAQAACGTGFASQPGVVAQARHRDPSDDGNVPAQSIARRTLIQASIVLGLLALAMLVWYSLHVLLLIFAGVLMAILLRGLADFVAEKLHVGPGVALAIVIVTLVVVFGSMAWLLAGTLIDQTAQLIDQVPQRMDQLKVRMQQTGWGKLALRFIPSGQDWQAWGRGMFGNVSWIFRSALGAVVTAAVILFIGLYMAADPKLYIRGALWLIPRDRRDRVSEVMGAVGYTLKWWLIGQAVDMVIIGVATAAAMWLIGVPLALLIGFLAAIFNFIPNFGPLFALVPALLLSMTDGPEKAMWVVLAFVILQTIEGYFLLPLILRRAVNVPAAMSIVAQVLLSLLAGGIGLALAAPLAAATLVTVKMLYVEDTLQEHIDTPDQGPAKAEIREVKKAKDQVEREADKPEAKHAK